MDLQNLLTDITPEELEPRLELQVLTDPIGASFADTNNNNCSVKDACNIKLSA
jgi:hypothetical protein